MSQSTHTSEPAGAVVGTIHSPAALREALRLKAGAVDFLEVRVDHFVDDFAALRRAVAKLKAPTIVTVRHPGEGGANGLGIKQRAALYREFMEGAAYIDIELRSMKALADVWAEAAERGVGRIVSWHDFKSTPKLGALVERWEKARGFKPSVIKFATRTKSRGDLATLLSFLASRPARPATSVMGMKEFGKVSRLALAVAGSALNYGYLGELQVPGQIHAPELTKRIAEFRISV